MQHVLPPLERDRGRDRLERRQASHAELQIARHRLHLEHLRCGRMELAPRFEKGREPREGESRARKVFFEGEEAWARGGNNGCLGLDGRHGLGPRDCRRRVKVREHTAPARPREQIGSCVSLPHVFRPLGDRRVDCGTDALGHHLPPLLAECRADRGAHGLTTPPLGAHLLKQPIRFLLAQLHAPAVRLVGEGGAQHGIHVQPRGYRGNGGRLERLATLQRRTNDLAERGHLSGWKLHGNGRGSSLERRIRAPLASALHVRLDSPLGRLLEAARFAAAERSGDGECELLDERLAALAGTPRSRAVGRREIGREIRCEIIAEQLCGALDGDGDVVEVRAPCAQRLLHGQVEELATFDRPRNCIPEQHGCRRIEQYVTLLRLRMQCCLDLIGDDLLNGRGFTSLERT